MAPEIGTPTDSLTGAPESAPASASTGLPTERQADADSALALHAQLRDKPFSFDFFQAVRRIECVNPHRPRIGHSSHITEDPVRFAQVPSLAFAPSTLAEFDPATRTGAPRLSVHFFGLLGANGPMPLHLTEFVRDREMNLNDPTPARFLDLFHHRMLALFYRAWASNRQAVSHDRASDHQSDRWAAYVASLVGVGMPSLTNRDEVPDVAKLHYSGRLVCATRHAEGLEKIVEDFFGLRTQIEQFVGQWIALPRESGCRLGASRESGTLGETIVVGSRVWDVQQKFRIRLGPMTFANYQRMLPGAGSLKKLVAWVKNYVGLELDWDARLVLKKDEVPKLHLGKVGQLGWSTWLHSKPAPRDVDDLVLRPEAA